MVLAVGKLLVDPVGLVGGGDDDSLRRLARYTTGLEQVPGAADVDLEGVKRGARRRPHDGTGREMEHGLHAVILDRRAQRGVVEQIGCHRGAALGQPAQEEAGGFSERAVEDEHLRTLVQQPLGDPGADEALGAGEQHARSRPGTAHSARTVPSARRPLDVFATQPSVALGRD